MVRAVTIPQFRGAASKLRLQSTVRLGQPTGAMQAADDLVIWGGEAVAFERWRANAASGARATLRVEPGPWGAALRFDFALAGPGSWVIARCDITLELPTHYVMTLRLRRDASPNELQVKLVDASRAECENRIKELKEDFGAGGFCLQSFHSIEAVFRLICCLYNLMAEFGLDILHAPPTPAHGARSGLGRRGGDPRCSRSEACVASGLTRSLARALCVLLARIAAYTIPTVAQCDLRALSQQLGPPRQWKPRRRKRPHPYSAIAALVTY